MNRFGFVCAAVVSLTGLSIAASAADIAPRPYTKALPPAAVYNWNGFYVGAHGGYGWGQASLYATPGGRPSIHRPSGALAGGQVGYNWQVLAWVFGVEADGDWANIRGSAPCPNPIAACASETRALASFRGRFGWAFGPALLYATGGLGYANSRYSALSVATGLPGGASNGFYSGYRWGYTIGAGIEYGFAPNWSAKLEYLHYGFDAVDAPRLTINVVEIGTTLRVDTVKAGINYRFGGPILAKY